MIDLFLKIALFGDIWVLYILLAASVLSLAVMVDRWRAFSAQRGDLAELMDGLAAKLEAHDVKGAAELAEASPRVEARVALEGLRNFPKGPASVEEVMASRWLRERLKLDKRLIVLSTLGNNAPFIGLFGTVLGIIKAFNDLAASGQSGVAVVMAGISSALVATAFGILVAIPAVVANNYFVSRLKQMQANTESLRGVLLAYLKSEK
ncbi:MAG TPA: MotA/TolQ/ExbB proton channel family protein [bacterium]|jgi:biopolymer transport protein ExbB/TolQ|nr:MotA/TolQ/ExbB proton channel family protein [bacterium]